MTRNSHGASSARGDVGETTSTLIAASNTVKDFNPNPSKYAACARNDRPYIPQKGPRKARFGIIPASRRNVQRKTKMERHRASQDDGRCTAAISHIVDKCGFAFGTIGGVGVAGANRHCGQRRRHNFKTRALRKLNTFLLNLIRTVPKVSNCCGLPNPFQTGINI